jgi:GTPase SAR1 family protein
MKSNTPKLKYKLVFLGDQHVGKTALINRFINNTYDQTYNVSIPQMRPQSESISSSRTSPTKKDTIGCNSGTQPDRKDLKVSFPAI